MKAPVAPLVVVLAFCAAACSSANWPGGAFFGPRSPETMIAFPQSQEGAEYLQALGGGTLVLKDGCLRKVDGDDSRLIVWPASSQPTPAMDGAVDTTTGRRITVGQKIRIGGGEVDSVDPTAFDSPIPTTCVGPYWLAAPGYEAVE